MRPAMTRTARLVARLSAVAAIVVAAPGMSGFAAAASELRPAADVIRAAVLERVGAGAEVTLAALDVPGPATAFRSARPDPEGRLDKPMRFTLSTATGASVIGVVSVHVVVDHAVTRRAMVRGEVLSAADLQVVRDGLRGLPLRKLPTADQLIGARALQPLAAGAIVMPGSIAIRRVVEPGDRVTVLATSGAVQVSAAMVAADGGGVGDVVRVVSPGTRRYLRGRILSDGRIEVMYER